MADGKIFVATDLSEPAGEALRQADELSRARGAELVVCHVLANPLRSNMLFPQLNEQMALELPAQRERVIDELTAAVAEATGRTPAEFSTLVDDGAPARVIVDKAERYGADLIVVGGHGHGHGRGTGTRVVLGSVAEQIVRWAHCPVLVARGGRPHGGPVVAATELAEAADPVPAAGAAEARRRDVNLVLMHAIDLGVTGFVPAGFAFGGVVYSIPPEVTLALRGTIRTKLVATLAALGVPGEVLVGEGPPAPSIVEAARELAAGLVVVGAHGAQPHRRVTLGSVAEAVARHAPCSVLIARAAPAAPPA